MHHHTLLNKHISTNLIKCSKYGHCAFVDSLHDQKLAQRSFYVTGILYIGLWALK